jgi:hypothetical protein
MAGGGSVSRIYIGIDNGLTGGLVALSDHPGPPILSWTMPIKAKAKGNEVSAEFVWDFIDKWDREYVTVILETPGKHSPGAQALCSMWDSFGAIRGVLESRGVRHIRIAPQTWQKAMLGKLEKGQTKPAALSKARQLWPDEKWLATPRSTKPHEGLIDAALIAEYARINQL